MTLSQAINQFEVQGIDSKALQDQEAAFQRCLSFLKGIEKIKTINKKHGSYGLKHMVENPSGYFGRKGSPGQHTGYVYEGTLILAAYACGFRVHYNGVKGLHANLNISERSLKKKVLSL